MRRVATVLLSSVLTAGGMAAVASPAAATAEITPRDLTITVEPGALAQTGRPLTTPARASFLTRGPGIAVLDRERVLQPFVRLDESRSTPGTGLGLALVSAVASLHGASLHLSDAAPGLVVTLRFPSGAAT